MTDNKKIKGGSDRRKVSSKEAYEVEYLHSKFPDLSHQQVHGAIRAVGPERKDILNYLKDKGKI